MHRYIRHRWVIVDTFPPQHTSTQLSTFTFFTIRQMLQDVHMDYTFLDALTHKVSHTSVTVPFTSCTWCITSSYQEAPHCCKQYMLQTISELRGTDKLKNLAKSETKTNKQTSIEAGVKIYLAQQKSSCVFHSGLRSHVTLEITSFPQNNKIVTYLQPDQDFFFLSQLTWKKKAHRVWLSKQMRARR